MKEGSISVISSLGNKRKEWDFEMNWDTKGESLRKKKEEGKGQ